MSEYIYSSNGEPLANERGEILLARAGEVVRCRDCKNYYEVDEYHPNGNYVIRCCKYFDTFNDEVKPDGFCSWGRRWEP